MKDENNKPANQVAEVSAETLAKLASHEEAIRQSGLIDIFAQHLPQIPADYIYKRKDREFVADSFHAAYELNGGLRRLALYANENYGEFLKLFARMLPEAQKAETGPAVVQVFHNVPPSSLDVGDIVDMEDLDDE